MDDTDLIIESLNEAERDLVLGLTVRRDSIPMAINHLSELLVRCQPLPLEAIAPVLEEPPCPALALIAPHLTKGLLEEIGRVEPRVRGQQGLQGLAAIEVQVLAVREQRVLLALDVAPFLASESGVLALAHLIERLAQVAQDVELVEQDRCLRRFFLGHGAKRFPHVHHRQADACGLGFAQPVVDLRQARRRAVLTAKPDRAATDEVAHHDAVGVALADRDLVHADGLGGGVADLRQLRRHVLLLQRLDRVPVKPQFLGHVLDGRAAAASADVPSEALGVERVVGQEVELLPLHGTALPAGDAPHLNVEIHAGVTTRQVAHPAPRAVIPARACLAAGATDCFFTRRFRVMTRAFGSPKTPCTVDAGRKPGNAYASSSRRLRLRISMGKSCQNSAALHKRVVPVIAGPDRTAGPVLPTPLRDEPFSEATEN